MRQIILAKGEVQGKKERNINGVNESEFESHMSTDGLANFGLVNFMGSSAEILLYS